MSLPTMPYQSALTIPEPLVVVLGPTAGGKTALAIELAKEFKGEVICADSRTIYRHMDIGTAKPTELQRQGIKHHLLDILDPGQNYSAANFQKDANSLVASISANDILPIVVGGTGLYIDSILYGYTFGSPVDPKVRQKLNESTLEELQQIAAHKGIRPHEVSFSNRRHLQRAVESGGIVKQQHCLRKNTLVLGLCPKIDVLQTRIISRIDTMLEDGLLDEVKCLRESGMVSGESKTAVYYRIFCGYLDGNISLDEAKTLFARSDRALAKRQITWFKRNSDIVWLDMFGSLPNQIIAAHKEINTFLNKFS